MTGHGRGHCEEVTVRPGLLIGEAGWMEKLFTKIETRDLPLLKGLHLQHSLLP